MAVQDAKKGVVLGIGQTDPRRSKRKGDNQKRLDAVGRVLIVEKLARFGREVIPKI